MNTKATPSMVKMEDETKSNLVQTPVAETVATHHEKQFTAVDIWQIHKQMKMASRTAKRWNLN